MVIITLTKYYRVYCLHTIILIHLHYSSYFLVGDCPDPELCAEPDDPRFDNPTFTMLRGLRVNGMYPEGFRQMISCPGSKDVWSTCDDAVWTPPLDYTGSNIIIHYFKIEKHT